MNSNSPLTGRKNKKAPAKLLVKITRGTVAGLKRRQPGDIVDLPVSEARFLIAKGKAIETKPVTTPSANVTESEDDESTEKPKRRLGRPPKDK